MAEENDFDVAAEKARKDLDAMYTGFTPEEKKVALKIFAWWKNNFMHAGHKRLGRILANFK
jgi:hypothetical protein